MNKILANTLLAVGLSVSLVQPANAQEASVIAACATPGATTEGCLASLSAYVAALQAQGLSTAQIDAAIGALVVALAQSAPNNPAVVAAAISSASGMVSNPAQQAAIAQLSATVAAGAPLPAELVAQVASPN